jgi:hypothetical protein
LLELFNYKIISSLFSRRISLRAGKRERTAIYYPFQKSWQGRKEREREIWKVQIL